MFLEISQNSQGNTCARLLRRCFPMNFGKFLTTPFSQNTSGLLLLNGGFLMARYVSYDKLQTGYSCSSSTVYNPRHNPNGWYKDQKFKNFQLLLLFTNAPVLDKKIWLKQLRHVKQIWIRSNHAYIWLVKTLMTCISTLIYFPQLRHLYYVSIIWDCILVLSVTTHHILQSDGNRNVVGSIRHVFCSHLERYSKIIKIVSRHTY